MPENKSKHMDIHDRVRIQKGIENKESFAKIAREIGVATSTVSREVKLNRRFYVPKSKRWNLCIHKKDCTLSNICGGCEVAKCRSCVRVKCWEVCSAFEESKCEILDRAPFVCGDCHRNFVCGMRHATYIAADAQLSYETRLVSSREGVSLTPEQLESVVTTVRRCLRQGWSIEAIWAVYGPRMPICERTMYNYIESGIMGLANIELPKKVKYKPRRKVADYRKVDRDGRSYSDFLDLPADKRERAVQMDTVIGAARDTRCILTLHFPKPELQLMVLLDEHTCQNVVGVLDWIETIIGTAEFTRLFGIILTDRGIEFCDFEAIESSCLGPVRRCRVYYCDPRRSDQKASCEKNHAMIRRIIPKGTSMQGLSQYDVATMCSHVNSYPRASLGGKCPLAAASRLVPRRLLDELGISKIPPQEVTLKPEVLRREQRD